MLAAKLAALDPKSPRYATEAVDGIVAGARQASASDVHLLPGAEGLEIRYRIDGVLQLAGKLPSQLAANVVSRLKVLADLLTYRTETPQEGRIRSEPGEVEMRVSTFPTLYGEKAVIRLFADSGRYHHLVDLGLPDEVLDSVRRLMEETSGMILVSGPAGSGKTTTVYACLREIVASTEGRRSVVSIEDPIEVALTGVSQSQVHPPSGFDLATGLRSLMRQDPEVIAVGEIRDRLTAEGAFNASLTGHLVVSTLHAGSASGAIGRLADMGIEPYVLRSGLRAVLAQRLVRKLCPECSVAITEPSAMLGFDANFAKSAVGCEACRGTGYRGRMLLVEILEPSRGEVGRAILERSAVDRIEREAIASGMTTRWGRAREAVERGLTSPSEVRRVLGFPEFDPGN